MGREREGGKSGGRERRIEREGGWGERGGRKRKGDKEGGEISQLLFLSCAFFFNQKP